MGFLFCFVIKAGLIYEWDSDISRCVKRLGNAKMGRCIIH